jgi:hypothetical protein
MRLPEVPYMNKESSVKTGPLNTLTLSGLSLFWAIVLGYASPWWWLLAVPLLLGGYGNEISPRKDSQLRL